MKTKLQSFAVSNCRTRTIFTVNDHVILLTLINAMIIHRYFYYYNIYITFGQQGEHEQ